MLGSISGKDAGKIRDLVEKYAGKAGDDNASAALAVAGGGMPGLGQSLYGEENYTRFPKIPLHLSARIC